MFFKIIFKYGFRKKMKNNSKIDFYWEPKEPPVSD